MSGCTNSRVPPAVTGPVRIRAPRSASAASAASSEPSPATAAASVGWISVPRTAQAQAKRTVEVPRRSRRAISPLPLTAAARSRSRCAPASVGVNPRSRTFAVSSTASKGLPAVTAQHSRQKASSAWVPRSSRTRRATGRGAERFEVEGALARAAGQSPERLGVIGEFLRPVGDDEQQWQFLRARREGREPAERFGVGPVRVVEEQHHRGALHCQVREHPVETVAQALLVGRGALGRRAQAERRADDRVPTPQRGTDFGLRCPGELRLQKLAGHVEGDALLLVAAARRQYGAASDRGAPTDLREECRLTESGACREGEERAAGASRRFGAVPAQPGEFVQRLVSRGEFTLTFEECPSAPCVSLPHGAPPGTVSQPARGAGAHRDLQAPQRTPGAVRGRPVRPLLAVAQPAPVYADFLCRSWCRATRARFPHDALHHS